MIVEPQVFLIGESVVNKEGLSAFLTHLGVPEWESNAPTDIELLTEVYGRACYKSFGTELNPNLTRVRGSNEAYISNVIEKGDGSVLEHGVANFFFCDVSRTFTHELVRHRVGTAICLTGDTLISSEHYANGALNRVPKRRLDYLYGLTKTPQGRSRIPLLRLRVLDEGSGKFTSTRHGVKSIVYTGKHPVFEVTLENGYKCKMTKNHKVLTSTGWKTLENAVQFLEVWPSGKAYYGLNPVFIATNGYRISETAILNSTGIPLYRDKDWLEGQIKEGTSFEEIAIKAGVSVNTIKTWKTKHGLGGIRRANSSLWAKPGNKGKSYKLRPKTESEKHAISVRMTGSNNHRWKGLGGRKNRLLPYALRKEILTRDNFKCVLCDNSRWEWNGRKIRLEIHHIDPWELDKPTNLEPTNLIVLCKLCHTEVTNKEQQFADLFFSHTTNNSFTKAITIPPRNYGGVKPKYTKIIGITYRGIEDTYDIIMNDPHHNFVANGLVVHNSQESLRFVRLTDLNFYAPLCIQENDEAMTLFTKTFEELSSLQKEMAELFDVDRLDSFHKKKEITSAMRRLAPIGLATNIGWSCNMRTLRHVIEMRTDPGAEEEIRLVFAKVADIAIARWPNLFADYSVEIIDDFPSFKTMNKKV